MKKLISLTVMLGVLSTPAAGYADHWKRSYGHGYGYRHRPKEVVIVKDRRHHDGAAILAGVLGGVATGIILDRVLISPPAPQPVYYPPPANYPPPAPAPRDPYDAGYSDGYGHGVQRGRQERYEQGRRRGYDEGYEDARDGRAF